jgi:hypothetical protein
MKLSFFEENASLLDRNAIQQDEKLRPCIGTQAGHQK